MARNKFKFDNPLTPLSGRFGKATAQAPSRPTTPKLGTAEKPASSGFGKTSTHSPATARLSNASTPSGSESPMSIIHVASGFTAVNATSNTNTPIATTLPSTAVAPAAAKLPPPPLHIPGPQNREKINDLQFKPYSHPGFEPGTFGHSNYAYRQYKTSAPPDFKAFKHAKFPEGTFEHSNYGYRNNKSGLGGTSSRENSISPTEYQSPQYQLPPPPLQQQHHFDPESPAKRQKSNPEPVVAPIEDRRASISTLSSVDSSRHLVSPPITPALPQTPKFATNKPVRLTITVQSDSSAQKRKSKPPVSPKRRASSPSPPDPDGSEDELSRPSVLTLREWDEEDGHVSMVQDYRLLMGGELLVGKVQSSW
jgi:hypothetical protein